MDTPTFVAKITLTYKHSCPILSNAGSSFLSNHYNEDKAVSL